MSGYLELIIGPMWSGKTSKLLDLYRQMTFCEIPTMVINYSHDTRYSETQLSTHDQRKIDCIMALQLKEIADITSISREYTTSETDAFSKSEVILINEGQFFSDVVEWTEQAVDVYHKKVYICGLDGDFERKPFGNWLDLIPICDKVSKLNSYCGNCKKFPAIFTYRKTKDQHQTLIGSDEYLPVCRKCYHKLTNG